MIHFSVLWALLLEKSSPLTYNAHRTMGNDISQGNWFPVPSFHVRYQMRAFPSPPLSTKTSDKFPDSIRGMRDVWIYNSFGSMKASWQIASGHPQKSFPTPSPKTEAKHFSLPSHWLGFNRESGISVFVHSVTEHLLASASDVSSPGPFITLCLALSSGARTMPRGTNKTEASHQHLSSY